MVTISISLFIVLSDFNILMRSSTFLLSMGHILREFLGPMSEKTKMISIIQSLSQVNTFTLHKYVLSRIVLVSKYKHLWHNLSMKRQ